LRGTGSHDYAVADMFVPAAHSLSFREPPSAPGPLYALPTIALFGALLAAVPLGIARHAIDILAELAGTKIATRSQQALREDATMRGDLGRAEALLRSGRAFLYEALDEAWNVITAGQTLSVTQRAKVWLASTHAVNAAKQATELMFSAGGATAVYTSSGLERCLRDVHAAGQHLTLASTNYEMVGQALLGSDMRATPCWRGTTAAPGKRQYCPFHIIQVYCLAATCLRLGPSLDSAQPRPRQAPLGISRR
jgi:alkylation response protein AidB-like acyl-CoA dehydrogenase